MEKLDRREREEREHAEKASEKQNQDSDALLEVCRERDGLKERCEELEVRCQHEHELEERESLSVNPAFLVQSFVELSSVHWMLLSLNTFDCLNRPFQGVLNAETRHQETESCLQRLQDQSKGQQFQFLLLFAVCLCFRDAKVKIVRSPH